jgi:hypothetical protein
MNIFSVLSTGKSNLHEPSMSAMFAYLLNPNQDHGLGRKFINNFLELANHNKIYDKFIDDKNIKFEIDLEVSYQYKNKGNDIDIQIKILDSSYNEKHRIIIENKIKQGSANSKQLNSYYQAVINDKDNDDFFDLEKENLSVIFLTPKPNKGLTDEFNNLDIENKVWLYWNNEDAEEKTIVQLIQNILKLEQEAKISPINEYIKHTLKAFTYYIIKTIDISSGKNRASGDIGNIKREKEIQITGMTHTIILRDSGQIQLFNQDGDKITARKLLKDFLRENNIQERGNCLTTRCFGMQIFKEIFKNK